MVSKKIEVTKDSIDFKNKKPEINNRKEISDEWIQKLFQVIEDVKYGSVTLIIQDGVVIQIERNEKMRLK
ncbi:MAG: YezD family protein [Bacillota bacterium]|nr:YezD family protein [Bacillota bacterium]